MSEKLSRILYAEDDDDIRTLAVMALTDIGGLEVVACCCGDEAIQQLPSTRPQLILLDVMMPGMDGPQVLAAVQAMEDFKSIPVVFMTAKVNVKEVGSYLALGAAGVITKPFDPMTLADQLRDIWQNSPRA